MLIVRNFYLLLAGVSAEDLDEVCIENPSTLQARPYGSKWGDDFTRISSPAPFHRFPYVQVPDFLEKHRLHRIYNVRNCVK